MSTNFAKCHSYRGRSRARNSLMKTEHILLCQNITSSLNGANYCMEMDGWTKILCIHWVCVAMASPPHTHTHSHSRSPIPRCKFYTILCYICSNLRTHNWMATRIVFNCLKRAYSRWSADRPQWNYVLIECKCFCGSVQLYWSIWIRRVHTYILCLCLGAFSLPTSMRVMREYKHVYVREMTMMWLAVRGTSLIVFIACRNHIYNSWIISKRDIIILLLKHLQLQFNEIYDRTTNAFALVVNGTVMMIDIEHRHWHTHTQALLLCAFHIFFYVDLF